MTAGRDTSRRRVRDTAVVHVTVGIAIGVCAAVIAVACGVRPLAPLIGWDVAAAVYLAWTWLKVGRLDPDETADHAVREDPTRRGSDLLVLAASVASLVAVGFVIVRAGDAHGAHRALQAALGTVSVVLSWFVVHTTFVLRYAKLYHANGGRGVQFNQDDGPRYADFAYLAFTIGMTFQVSDTNLNATNIRSAALRQALLSYLFGTVIIATTINMIVSLSN